MRTARLTLPALLASALLALGVSAVTAAPVATGATASQMAATAYTTARLSGPNRYATSVAVSKGNFVAPQEHVVVASGLNFPDALGAGPFAALVGAPLLLVPTTGTLPTVVAAELDRLKTQDVIVVGGPSSVSSSMVAQLEKHTTGKVSYQVSGSNRYDTAAQLTEGFDPALTGVPVYLASGTTFPDALGGGAAASLSGGVLLLTSPTKLPAETAAALKRVKPTKVVVLGGTSSISSAVLSQVKTVVGSSVPVSRIGGANRYATGALTSKGVLTTGASEVLLANGLQYPDALSGAAVAPYFGGRPVLLTKAECVPAETLAEIKRLGATKITALGGPTMVSDAALQLKAC